MQPTTSSAGLTASEVEERRTLGLDNRQTFKTSRSLLLIFRANLLTFFNAIVGAAFLVLIALGQWRDALFGLAVLSNIAIGVVQEVRSKLALDRLAILNRAPVRVKRSGELTEVLLTEVVRDDLIALRIGEQIPVDARVTESNDLQVDESLLTGESEPKSKLVGDSIFAGSYVTGGHALAIATHVGADTYASKILVDAKKFSLVSSELRESIARLIKWISLALVPVTAIVLYGQLRDTQDPTEGIVLATASVISMVPQGLVLITSIAFALAATRLARRKVLVQELAAVEGLARVDVVCLDKTGTLTTGALVFDDAELQVDAETALGRCWSEVLGAFASDPDANATASALRIRFPQSSLEISDRTQFDSAKKWSGLTARGVKWRLGAPEVLSDDPKVLKSVEEFAAAGRRTLLLVAEEAEVTPVCILTFREEVRADASETLAYLEAQGVDVRVLSGDHPITVAHVAKEAGLQFEGSGFDARNLSDDPSEIGQTMASHKIFGRVTPEQKRLMVTGLQNQGRVVAMIGDGINDALALKEADLGIAMGSGAPATRAVANLVLLDSNFSAVPKVVSEGRRVIANVERLSRLFLTKTVWAMLLALTFGLAFWDYPFLPRQLSAIDGFAIGVPAFLLALLPNHQVYRAGFLKRSLIFCIPAGVVTAIAVIALTILMQGQSGWSSAEMQTAASILLSATSIWVLVTLAKPVSPARIGIVVLMSAAAVALFSFPVSVEFFGFAVLTPDQLIQTFAVSLVAVLVMAVTKGIMARSRAFGLVEADASPNTQRT
ncbi:MAG: hypothetical protein RLZZ108_8 [Actinomycetota bacterium]